MNRENRENLILDERYVVTGEQLIKAKISKFLKGKVSRLRGE